jgi:hypothetical protein
MASTDVWRKWQLAAKGGPEGLALVSAPLPSAGRSEVVVKILATTATYTDLLVCQGNYRPTPPYPLTPGYDAVGDVVEVCILDIIEISVCHATLPLRFSVAGGQRCVGRRWR